MGLLRFEFGYSGSLLSSIELIRANHCWVNSLIFILGVFHSALLLVVVRQIIFQIVVNL